MKINNKELFSYWTPKKDMVLYVNDRLQDAQRIMFQVCKVNEHKKVISSSEFFMDILSVKHLGYRVLMRPLEVNEPWNRVRVSKNGNARAITVTKTIYKNQPFYSFKIDGGKGEITKLGDYKMTQQEKSNYIYLPEVEAEILLLELQEELLLYKFKLNEKGGTNGS